MLARVLAGSACLNKLPRTVRSSKRECYGIAATVRPAEGIALLKNTTADGARDDGGCKWSHEREVDPKLHPRPRAVRVMQLRLGPKPRMPPRIGPGC